MKALIATIILSAFGLICACKESVDENLEAEASKKIKTSTIYLLKDSKLVISEKREYSATGQLILRTLHFPESNVAVEKEYIQYYYQEDYLLKEVHTTQLLSLNDLRTTESTNDYVFNIINFNEHKDTVSIVNLCQISHFTYEYPPNSTIKTESTEFLCNSMDAPSSITRISRFENNRMTSIVCDELNINETYKYELSGNKLVKVYRNGQLFEHYMYDNNGKCIKVKQNIDLKPNEIMVTRKFNREGRLIRECRNAFMQDILFTDLQNCQSIEYFKGGDTAKIVWYGAGIHTNQKIDADDFSEDNSTVLVYKYVYY